MPEDPLEFFNGLSGRLHLELSEPPVPFSPNLDNKVAPPNARIVRADFRLRVFTHPGFRALTDEEWGRVVIDAPRIRMANDSVPEVVIEHAAPDGRAFTVRDLEGAIAKTERESRGDGEWLGGIDVHHVYFEGIELEGGVWRIHWGS